MLSAKLMERIKLKEKILARYRSKYGFDRFYLALKAQLTLWSSVRSYKFISTSNHVVAQAQHVFEVKIKISWRIWGLIKISKIS